MAGEKKGDQGKALALIRDDLGKMTGQFQAALQGAIPTDRFVRHVLTAIQTNPDLLTADRRSLWSAVMKSAQDGLLPDGREGALVVYGTKVQWQPMVRGLMKLARNSGEIASITAHVVYEFDKVRIVKGDDERIDHEENLDAEQNIKTARGAYAIATLKDGTKIRRWLSRAKIMKAKSISKAPNGPLWGVFEEEAWLKTAIRNLSKYLPASTDKEGTETFVRAVERIDDDADFGDRTDAVKDVTPPADDSLKRFMDRKGVKPDRATKEEEPDEPPEPEPDDPGPEPEDDELGETEADLLPDDPELTPLVELHFPGMSKPVGYANDLLALEAIQARCARVKSQLEVTEIYEAVKPSGIFERYPAMLQTLQEIADTKPPTRRGGRGQRDMLQPE